MPFGHRFDPSFNTFDSFLYFAQSAPFSALLRKNELIRSDALPACLYVSLHNMRNITKIRSKLHTLSINHTRTVSEHWHWFAGIFLNRITQKQGNEKRNKIPCLCSHFPITYELDLVMMRISSLYVASRDTSLGH